MPLSQFVVSIVAQARCTAAPLAVAVDCKNPSGQLIAAAFDPTQPSQLWFPLTWGYCVNEGFFTLGLAGCAFVNVLTGMAMYSAGRDGSPLLQVPVGQIGGNSVWCVVGGAPYFAVRLLSDADQNLYIQGSSPYTAGMTLGTTGWHSDPNEVWSIVQTNAPYPAAFDQLPYQQLLANLTACANLNLSSNGQPGDTSQMTVQTPAVSNAAQQFTIPTLFNSSTGGPSGIAIINQASGNAVHAASDSQGAVVNQVAYPPLDNYSMWSLGPPGWSAGFAVRPFVDDGQNLNIPGDGPYSAGQTMITYGWGGGASNESWNIDMVTHSLRREAAANQKEGK